MKKRVISAVILLMVIIPLIIIGKIPFALAIGLISILAYYEFLRIFKYPKLVILLGFISLIVIIYNNFDFNNIISGINYKYLALSLLLCLIPGVFYQEKGLYTVKDGLQLFAFIFLLGFGLNSFIVIRSKSLTLFLFTFLIPVFTDTFAYIGGNLIGKHHFTKISPNKTIEGIIVGSLMTTFIMSMYYFTFINQEKMLIKILIIFILTLIAEIGDLFFSAIKREYKIKDFSNIIPGHGGILDRLDSLLFVAITFMMLIEYL